MSETTQVPKGWPPSWTVPLFPLPNLFLFPGTAMPLHIFEPRYRRMIEDLLDGPGRMVIGTVEEEHHHDLSGSPPVIPVAGLGEIARHERLDDGRFVILIVGLGRVRIHEVPSDQPYRLVEAMPVQETPPAAGEAKELRTDLAQALKDRNTDVELPENLTLSHLTDLLLLRMQLPQSAMQELYAILEVAERARGALDEHERRPIVP